MIIDKYGIIDMQNLMKTLHIENKTYPGPVFTTLEEIKVTFLQSIKTVLSHWISLDKIYIVFKSFNFKDHVTQKTYNYHEIAKYMLWLIHTNFVFDSTMFTPFIILIESLDNTDKEVDDRALFVIYKSLQELDESSIIFSNDSFNSLSNQIGKVVKLSYYKLIECSSNWTDGSIINIKTITKKLDHGSYTVIHPYNYRYAHMNIII